MTTELRARPGRVASRHPADGNNGDDDGAVQNLNGELAKWQVLESIAECQGKMWLNWHKWWPQFVLAPATNWQEILSRWVIGNQVNIYKSSDPALEETIRNRVAGYGSQLGTILDYLERVQKDLRLKPADEKNPKDPINELNQLIDQVRAAKKMFGRA